MSNEFTSWRASALELVDQLGAEAFNSGLYTKGTKLADVQKPLTPIVKEKKNVYFGTDTNPALR